MEEKIKVIVWKTDGSDDGGLVYGLHETNAGNRFFKDLENNAELDGREHFTIEYMTASDFVKAQELGD